MTDSEVAVRLRWVLVAVLLLVLLTGAGWYLATRPPDGCMAGMVMAGC